MNHPNRTLSRNDLKSALSASKPKVAKCCLAESHHKVIGRTKTEVNEENYHTSIDKKGMKEQKIDT